ncbi:MAG: hypothetical protein EOO28_01255 [Comamonadaceae bacterium]|nr:MAG: hypothetical protein EOO28_01255 [Comamonadaceae bacterium]
MKRLTPLLLISSACLLAACNDSKAPKVPPAVPTPKATAPNTSPTASTSRPQAPAGVNGFEEIHLQRHLKRQQA